MITVPKDSDRINQKSMVNATKCVVIPYNTTVLNIKQTYDGIHHTSGKIFLTFFSVRAIKEALHTNLGEGVVTFLL